MAGVCRSSSLTQKSRFPRFCMSGYHQPCRDRKYRSTSPRSPASCPRTAERDVKVSQKRFLLGAPGSGASKANLRHGAQGKTEVDSQTTQDRSKRVWPAASSHDQGARLAY